MPGCRAACFAAGFLAAVAMFAAIVTVAARVKYEPLYREAQGLKPLLAEASSLLATAERENITGAYAEIYQQLPLLEKAVTEYSRLYAALNRYKPLILLVYNDTHSPEFNRTLNQINQRIKAFMREPIIGPVLAQSLQALAELMRQARSLSEVALQALNMTESMPPSKLRSLVEAAEAVAKQLPPQRLGKLLENASNAVMEANATLARLPEPRLLEEALASVSSLTAAATLALLWGPCRKKEEIRGAG